MKHFVDRVADFLERSATLGRIEMSYTDNERVYHFVLDYERLILIKGLNRDVGILNDEVNYLPLGFTNNAINTLKPKAI